MKFTKMHGIGNDYIYIDATREAVQDPVRAAVAWSDRHFGIGSDGLILIRPSDIADFEMDMYNADGSRSAMCGNGIRCVGKYVYDHGLTDKQQLKIATGAGIKTLDLTVENGTVRMVRVDMGAPVLEASKIPVRAQAGPVVDEPIIVSGQEYRMTCVSMGNPHCVVRMESDLMELPIEQTGPAFEHHERFPERVNAEFIRVLDRGHVQMRVWERGTGETLACGTGACAVTAACVLNGWTEEEVTIHLRGGSLKVAWDRAADRIYMTGPAVTVYEGEIDEPCE